MHYLLHKFKKLKKNYKNIFDFKTQCATVENEGEDSNDSIKLLPEPSSLEKSREIKLGEAVRFEELGPIIINPDGTTRRITNWVNLTKQEQASTFRLISARNKKRLSELQAKSENSDTITDKIGNNEDA